MAGKHIGMSFATRYCDSPNIEERIAEEVQKGYDAIRAAAVIHNNGDRRLTTQGGCQQRGVDHRSRRWF